jgi:hypothetical protein
MHFLANSFLKRSLSIKKIFKKVNIRFNKATCSALFKMIIKAQFYKIHNFKVLNKIIRLRMMF